ncbi:N-acetylmuramoyl-L-alanine amidase [Paenibacillus sp. LHD-117]|uniref:N-acetylmuramoyl-L-alanine amidase family protein n=1 Tax=Paenibacillus sp. LHD-117 TaxID=3071412 RepID=UPI0027E186C5|nr:N-acetylmuramoyl-L-alanine amidase [Paenibacillus sp. LHD-117]MDQ6422897.1 N-acetylmuramoyl-L-alanine amidase [Paenibacillus sp. LHD-117]
MIRHRRSKKIARFAVLPLVLLVLMGVVLIAASQFTKNSGEMTKALDGREEEPAQVSSGNAETEIAKETFKIMIDAGHGGKDPGAPGASGVEEKVSNLAIALKVNELLRQDPMFEVRMTRTDDTFVEIEDRSAMANDWDADVLLSIHGNSYEDGSVSGSETFYRYDNGLALATSIHQKLVDAMGFRDRGVRLNELKVLTLSQMPAILIETGYLTNAAEEAVILSEEGQNKMAQAIVDGLKQFVQQSAATK